ncbi:MAG: DinB family protein [Trueperaceae bacterium]
MSPFLITEQEGFTPHIGRLVSMMNYARQTTLYAVKSLSIEELDVLPTPNSNSIGMLLEHFAAVEVIYQAKTFDLELSPSVEERWKAGLDLGKLGREKIRGHDLSYYPNNLQTVREETLREFRKRDDEWLHQEFPFWGETGNNYFCWFHVFEDELNHRGQIRLITKQFPRFKTEAL